MTSTIGLHCENSVGSVYWTVTICDEFYVISLIGNWLLVIKSVKLVDL